jgi:hypothetical protein
MHSEEKKIIINNKNNSFIIRTRNINGISRDRSRVIGMEDRW